MRAASKGRQACGAGTGGKRRTEALGALQAMYVFQFCGSLAYGMWAVISPYFLEARGYSTVGAANMYTVAWVAYNVGQIIMSPIAGDIADGHGRRPVFLASAFVGTIFFLTFVYLRRSTSEKDHVPARWSRTS